MPHARQTLGQRGESFVAAQLRDAGYNMDRFRLICNRVGLESGHLGIEHVEGTLNFKVDHQLPDEWRTVSSSINIGIPLIESAPKSRIRAAIRELAQHIADPNAVTAKSGSHGGLFGKIFSGAT